MNILPRHKISTAAKYKRSKQDDNLNYFEKCINYNIDQAGFSEDREEVLRIARMINGETNDADYNYVLNPLNTTVDKYKRFGTKLRNFDIITPVRDLYIGEFGGRFKSAQVLDSNGDDDNSYKENLKSLVKNFYAQDVINNLNKLGVSTGKESQEQEALKDKVNNFNISYDDNKAVTGQQVLDYIYYDQDIDDKQQDAYNDWISYGRTYTYKGIYFDDIDYEVVPPWELWFPDNNRSNFLEDSNLVVRRVVKPVNQWLDQFHDKLSKEDFNTLEQLAVDEDAGKATGYVRMRTQYITTKEEYDAVSLVNKIEGIEGFHTQWRGWRKVGLLLYLNFNTGQEEELEVDDTYKFDKDNGDISIEWDWESVVNEGWRIGSENNYIYLNAGELDYNRMELNNSSTQKLSYNGRLNKVGTGEIRSLVKSGEPYQIIYNILHYQFEKIINKNKDKVMVLPQSLIPKGRGGWDEEKFMYYANAGSYMVIDDTKPNASIAMSGIKMLDMSLANYAKESIELMQAVKSEWWEAIGMNRQRYGDVKASDGKSVNEQAIARSAIISDELNRKFEKFMEKDYQGLLDLSKLAYLNGKKGNYINSDGRKAYLNLNADDAVNRLGTDFNLFVSNSKRESQKMEDARQYGFSVAQNGNTSEMLEMIDGNNFASIKAAITKMDGINKAREEAMAKAEQESNQAIETAKRESEQATRDVDKYKADKEYDKAIDVKYLEMGMSIEGEEESDLDNNGVNETNSEEIRMNDHKINMDQQDLKMSNKELALKSKEVDARIKAARSKPKPKQ